MVITNEAQPPQTITTTAGVNLKVLPGWVACAIMWVEITRCGFAISSSAGIENLPCEPVDIARQKCFHYKAFTVL